MGGLTLKNKAVITAIATASIGLLAGCGASNSSPVSQRATLMSCNETNSYTTVYRENSANVSVCSVETVELSTTSYNTELFVQASGVRIWLHEFYPRSGTAWCFNPGAGKTFAYGFSGYALDTRATAQDVQVTGNHAAC